MQNILLIGNGDACNADRRLKEEAKALNINIVDYWNTPTEDIEYIATINRRYLNNLIPLQRGKQINRMVDGIFWKNKITQLTSLNTACRKPKYLIGKKSGLDFQLIANTIDLPFIAKVSNSGKGNGVYLVRNINDFSKLPEECDIFEEVIWDSIGKDVRVYVVNGEVKCCMLRENTSNFKSNFHQGGKGSKYPIDNTIKDIAKHIYKTTNLTLMGIDLLIDRNSYVFCELNANPGFEELERACNYNAAREILDLAIK